MIRAVFFDVDFTLIYPGPSFQGEGYRQFCAKHGIGCCDPSAFTAAVTSASVLLDGLGRPRVRRRRLRPLHPAHHRTDGRQRARRGRVRRGIYREWAACHHFELYDDVLPALEALKSRGFLLGLISNTHRSLESFQSHFELDGLVSAAVASSEHGYNKPHPSIFRTALDLLAVSPDEAVMVGDNYSHDIEGARAVGMRAILLRRAAQQPPGQIEPGAVRSGAVPVITSLLELPGLLSP